MKHPSDTLILVIVQNPTTHQTLAELLAGTAFQPAFAAGVEEGLRAAEELLPAAVLVDLETGDFTAFDTCRRLRASRLLAGVPVLMLVDAADRDARVVALGAGADDFIDKPFDPLDLVARLRTVSRLNAYRFLMTDLSRFAWMAEHAREGYLLLDQAGNIQFANESAGRLLNLPEEFVGLPFRPVVEHLYSPEPRETWEHWQTDPESCFLVQPESPTARAVWLVLESLDVALGSDHQRMVRMREVTERMALYQDMRRFHTLVAHKLRTPMSILYTNLSLIKNRLEMLSGDEVKAFARGAIEGADRLVSEVRAVLTYIDAPLSLTLGSPLTLSALPAVAHDVAASLDLQEVNFSLPADLAPLTIALTPEAMEMILHELLENARKFHPQKAPRVDISISRGGIDSVALRLVDDGQSLSSEQLRWAWLPYFQGEKDFTGELPGLGLGIPMVATLIWQVGGEIRLRNRSDAPGLIVDIEIPLDSAARRRQRPASPYRGDAT